LDLGGDDCTPGPCIADAQITSTNQGDADDITFQMLAQDGGTSRNAFKVDYQSGNDVITVGNDEINAYLFETDNSAGDDLSYDDTNDRWEIGTAEVAVYGTRTLAWQPNEIDEDGTNCVASSNQLNGGPTITTIGCADSSSSVMQGSTIMPDGWDGGTVDLEIFVFHGTTETITFAGDFDAMCRGVGDVVNSTWGTAVAADVSITTANQLESAAATVTPNGTCAAGDQLFWRYTVDDVTFSANAANSEVTGVAMEWARVAGD
jgi:hypothetical protein